MDGSKEGDGVSKQSIRHEIRSLEIISLTEHGLWFEKKLREKFDNSPGT